MWASIAYVLGDQGESFDDASAYALFQVETKRTIFPLTSDRKVEKDAAESWLRSRIASWKEVDAARNSDARAKVAACRKVIQEIKDQSLLLPNDRSVAGAIALTAMRHDPHATGGHDYGGCLTEDELRIAGRAGVVRPSGGACSSDRCNQMNSFMYAWKDDADAFRTQARDIEWEIKDHQSQKVHAPAQWAGCLQTEGVDG